MSKHRKQKTDERPVTVKWVTRKGKHRRYASTDHQQITALCTALYLRYVCGDIRALHVIH